jgi:lysozyme
MPDSAPELDPSLISAVKGFEGFTPKAQWDYKQHSNGYGTKAQSPGEVIDRDTADQRLTSELGNAQSQVDQFAPDLPSGPRKALTSLTFNVGPGWMGSGLGNAVKSGDLDKAQNILLTYNKAGGQENPGLTARRQQEASWFNQPTTQTADAAPANPVATAPAALAANAGAAPGVSPAGAPSPSPPGMPSPQSGSPLGMLAGQMPAQPPQGQPQGDPNLDLLMQHAQAMMQEQPPAPPPLQPIQMPVVPGQLAARLRAAALGRGLTA